jgi:hypothetical protein
MEHIASNIASIKAKKTELEIMFYTKATEIENKKIVSIKSTIISNL